MPQKIFGPMPRPIDMGSDLMALCPTPIAIGAHGMGETVYQTYPYGYMLRVRQFANQTLWFSANPTAGFLPQPSFIRRLS
jgi:hypothetical protein